MTKRGRLSGFTLLVVAAGLVVTATLAVATQSAYEDNEDRLLEQRAQEVARVIETAIPIATTPLRQVATLVTAVGDRDAGVVSRGMESVLEESPYAHLSVWREGERRRVHSVGDTKLEITDDVVAGWFADAPQPDEDPLRIIDMVDLPDPRVGYLFTLPEPDAFIVYGERPTPEDRRTSVGQGPAFEAIDFALYLGTEAQPEHLVSTTAADQRLEGRTTTVEVPFGDTVLRVDVAANQRLGGNVLGQLPWQVGVGGLLSTVVGAVLVELLHRRHRDAAALAREVEVLYGREHDIAHTLQQSLLPRELPVVPGAELAVRYIAGALGTEVGGDWYDIVELGERRLGLVVGDVAGKGVHAAAVMAAMRYATHAIAAQAVAPDRILSQVNHLEGIRGDFVTMLCSVLDLGTGRLTFSRAGHPPPLLVQQGRARFLDGHVGPPVGFLHTSQYATDAVELRPGDTLLLYTDGLYERPDEDLDVGLERLRSLVEGFEGPLQALVDDVCQVLVGNRGRDDVALLAVRIDPSPATA